MKKIIHKAVSIFIALVGCVAASAPVTTPESVTAARMMDPTRPPGQITMPESSTTGQPLELTAIFVYRKYSAALVNGQMVKLGDKLGEFTITTITPDTVELTGPQNNMEVLRLVPTVKQRRQ